MATITALQEQWQKELTRFQQDDATITAKSGHYAEKVEALQQRMNGYRGISVLKKAFLRATQMVWLHHKQNKYTRRAARAAQHIEKAATQTLAAFSETVAANSAQAAQFRGLDTALHQMHSAQKTVQRAADKCSSALSTQKQAAAVAGTEKHWSHDFIANLYSRRAVRALRETEQQLQDIQHALHQSGLKIEAEIAKATKTAPFPFTFTSDNAQMAKQLSAAHDYIQALAGHLDTALLTAEKQKKLLIAKVLRQARKADPETDKFATALETYTSVKTLKKTALPPPPKP